MDAKKRSADRLSNPRDEFAIAGCPDPDAASSQSPTSWIVTPRSELVTRLAWSNGQSHVTRFGTATVWMPAALAACTPFGESSKATASDAHTFRLSSAAR